MRRTEVVRNFVIVGLLLVCQRETSLAQSPPCQGSPLPPLAIITDQFVNLPADWLGDSRMMALVHHMADAENRVIETLRPRLITYCIFTDPAALQAPPKYKGLNGVVVLDLRASASAHDPLPVALSITVRRVLGNRAEQNLFVDQRIFLIQRDEDYTRIADSADLLVQEGMSASLRKKSK